MKCVTKFHNKLCSLMLFITKMRNIQKTEQQEKDYGLYEK